MISYLQIENLSKSFGDRMLFSDLTLGIYEGDKIGIVAKNGAGKSTLMRIIAGEEDYDGWRIVPRDGLRIGYLEQYPPYDPEKTILQNSMPAPSGHEDWNMEDRVRSLLSTFGLHDVDRPAGTLSSGQVKRMALARLILGEPDLLMLDEPTNHLDMKTKDILKDAIKAFDGTVIVVSHDREFLDGLVDKVYEVGGGRIRENIGGIYDFLAKHNAELAKLASTGKSRRQPQEKTVEKHGEPGAPEPPKQKARLSYAEQKEQERMIRRARKELEKAEEEVAAREEEQQAAEQLLAQGDASPEILGKYNAATKALENAMSLWELAQQEYDRIMQ